jgi:hypothetical protein
MMVHKASECNTVFLVDTAYSFGIRYVGPFGLKQRRLRCLTYWHCWPCCWGLWLCNTMRLLIPLRGSTSRLPASQGARCTRWKVELVFHQTEGVL